MPIFLASIRQLRDAAAIRSLDLLVTCSPAHPLTHSYTPPHSTHSFTLSYTHTTPLHTLTPLHPTPLTLSYTHTTPLTHSFTFSYTHTHSHEILKTAVIWHAFRWYCIWVNWSSFSCILTRLPWTIWWENYRLQRLVQFRQWKLVTFNNCLIEGGDWWEVIIAEDSGLALNRWQTII